MPPFSAAHVASRALPFDAHPLGESESPNAHDYELLALVARGAVAEVWQVRERRSGQLFALKRLRNDLKDQRAAHRIFQNEAEIGSKVSSDYVVKVVQA